MSESIKINGNTSIGLDFLRAFCSQLVVFGHGISFVALAPQLEPPHFPYVQNISVVSFFILSGFLITYTVFEKNKWFPDYNFKEYFIERFARIYTGFIPCLIFILFFDLYYQWATPEYYHQKAFNLKTFTGNLLMLQDFPKKLFGITSFGSGRPLWTLAIEWWLYMFFGWAVLMFRWSKKSVFNFIAYILVLLPLAVVPLSNMRGRGKGLTLIWIMGSLCYFLWPIFKKQEVNKKLMPLLMIVFFAAAAHRSISKVVEYDLLFALFLTLSLFFFVQFLQSNKREIPYRVQATVRFFASFSFTLYMIHYSIMDYTRFAWKDKLSSLEIFLVTFFLSNIIAWVFSKVSEVHYRKVGEFLKRNLKRKSEIMV